MKQYLIFLMTCLFITDLSGQSTDPAKYIKISHAEPLFADLVKDLGVRKGEKELNLGWTVNNENAGITHGGFVEFEFSPLNRLGLEVEIPFSFPHTGKPEDQEVTDNGNIEELKIAAQYTFLVSQQHNISAAFGTLYAIDLHSFPTGPVEKRLLKGNAVNPFMVVAKKWGPNINSLISTGPSFNHKFGRHQLTTTCLINVSFHYVFRGSHFIGLEANNELSKTSCKTVFHPQIKLKIAEGFAVGFVGGVPANMGKGNIGFMTRLIIEPGRKK